MKKLIFILSLIVPALLSAQSYELQKARLNSVMSDFAARELNDSMVVFVSNRLQNSIIVHKDSQGNPPSNLYQAPKNELSKVSLFSEQINSLNNEGPFCFSADGNELYFTGTLEGKGSKKDKLGLFFSRKQGTEWSAPEALPFNSDDASFNTAHPSLSSDGKRLFFVSDRDGGFGDGDLYFSDKIGNTWSEPLNMGDRINSPFKECFPFFHPSGKLYFSSSSESEGLQLDIYSIDLSIEGSTPERLPEPLNSKSNDYAFWTDSSTEQGYLSSDRSGGDDDVFSFKFIYPAFDNCTESQEMELCYYISETEIVPVDSLPFKFVWDFGDGTSAEGLSNEHCFPKEGSYHIQLNIYDTLTNSVYARVSESELYIEKPNGPYIDYRSDAISPSLKVFEARTDYLEEFKAEGYYWMVEGAGQFQGASIQADINPKDSLEIKLLVLGRSDSTQTSRYCRSLKFYNEEIEVFAQAESEKELEKADESPRMPAPEKAPKEELAYFVEFYVSKEPVALDDPLFENVTYSITEREDENLDYRYSVGMADDPFALYPVVNDLKSAGFEETLVRENTIDEFMAQVKQGGVFMEESSEEEINEHLKEFSDVQFDLNEASISESSFENLDYIAWAMKLRPDLSLKVIAHTDNSGTEEYNLDLSQRRANSVVEYLIREGADQKRISWEGRGESEPLFPNTSEEGRSRNRRVEFKIQMDSEGTK